MASMTESPSRPLKTISVRRWYLEMRENLGRELSHPVPGTRVTRAIAPSVRYYRTLYNAVGAKWKWIDRDLLSDEELAETIQDERVEVYVLRVDGEPAGYGELDRRQGDEIELAYFGLLGKYTGRGLGKFLLNWLVLRAWAYSPSRLWLHTCELDHPAARPLYQQAGFEVFDERMIDQRVEA
ncbi:MAG: GNAT family N-acetyltransferase [Planctomycetota bacterium]|nr:MAG: GNAT family N-acetyltransferase [Planctomycetota bacterium]